jgi:hypothetical protein
MQIVGQYLQQEALIQTMATDRDFFGRSAFNRYYYATFLQVKTGLGSLRTEWSTMAHADIPGVLRGTVQRELKQGRMRAQKTADKEVITLCSRALAAVADLADLMEKGYATRVTADYHPEISVDFSSGVDFKLNTIAVGAAKTWPSRAAVLVGAITSAWKQLNA